MRLGRAGRSINRPAAPIVSGAPQPAGFILAMLKYLVLILVIAAVWYGYRYVNNRKKAAGQPVTPPPAHPQVKAEDMAACRVCGAYVAEATVKSCGRNDCPYPVV